MENLQINSNNVSKLYNFQENIDPIILQKLTQLNNINTDIKEKKRRKGFILSQNEINDTRFSNI